MIKMVRLRWKSIYLLFEPSRLVSVVPPAAAAIQASSVYILVGGFVIMSSF